MATTQQASAQPQPAAQSGQMADSFSLGMVGLGVMGRNLVLNMADHGFRVAGLDLDPDRVAALLKEAPQGVVAGVTSPADLVRSLERPRAVVMLVPAGKPVDSVIHELMDLLEPGDLLIDGGNSYFRDTQVRGKALDAKGLNYLGVGISGGEEGARRGPSMMPGGPKDAYERVRDVFESVAAHVGGDPCVAWLGPGAAGHYVKMVHNGIEYAIMQLIAETYDIMKRGLGMRDVELHETYARWGAGENSSYLLDITARIFEEIDPQTERPLVDVVLDEAKQLGTGEWASQDALELGVPTPNIDSAVAQRNVSALKKEREHAATVVEERVLSRPIERGDLVRDLEKALHAGMIISFAQGMAQLAAASRQYDYNLDLETVARIWRGGCIIRAALLEDLRRAFQRDKDLPNLLVDPDIAPVIVERQLSLRRAVSAACEAGLPVPGFGAALSYLDSYRSAWLPASLIQAQRDYFGAHTYERVDEKGVFHTKWPEVD